MPDTVCCSSASGDAGDLPDDSRSAHARRVPSTVPQCALRSRSTSDDRARLDLPRLRRRIGTAPTHDDPQPASNRSWTRCCRVDGVRQVRRNGRRDAQHDGSSRPGRGSTPQSRDTTRCRRMPTSSASTSGDARADRRASARPSRRRDAGPLVPRGRLRTSGAASSDGGRGRDLAFVMPGADADVLARVNAHPPPFLEPDRYKLVRRVVRIARVTSRTSPRTFMKLAHVRHGQDALPAHLHVPRRPTAAPRTSPCSARPPSATRAALGAVGRPTHQAP